MQLSQRFWNAHAMLNMAVWLRKEQASLASSIKSRLGVNGVKDAANCIAEVRVVVGSPRAELGGESALIVTRILPYSGRWFPAHQGQKMEASQLLSCFVDASGSNIQ